MGNEDKVIDWIQSGMDYNQGILLLVEITRKQRFQHQFAGGSRQMASKLAYEICKASAIADVKTWKDFIDQHKVQSGENPAITSNLKELPELTILETELGTDQTFLSETNKEYPTIIRRIVHEYASLFQERSKLHQVMSEMPESNTEALKRKRAEIFDMIKSLSARLEVFYKAKTLYESDGVLPDENELFPKRIEAQQNDLDALDEETLKKRKKNLQNGNSKDQFMLDYQSQESGSVKNPMPEGPKRIKIQFRIRQRIKQIEEIEKALLRHVIKE